MRHRDYYKDLIKDLEDPCLAAEYLNAALEAGDKKAFLLALRNVVEASGGMSVFAKRTGINRVSLYKIFSSSGNPEFGTLMHIFKTLGVKLALTPAQSRKKKILRRAA